MIVLQYYDLGDLGNRVGDSTEALAGVGIREYIIWIDETREAEAASIQHTVQHRHGWLVSDIL